MTFNYCKRKSLLDQYLVDENKLQNAIVENNPREESLAKIPIANPKGQTNWVIAAPKVQITGSPGKNGKYLPTTNSAKP